MDEAQKRPLRVFLCHTSQDKPAVRNLHRYLIQRGMSPWLDEVNLLPGQDWREEIPKAIFDSDVIVVCLSKTSINKEGYVQSEIAFALDKAKEKPEGTIFIIPARLEACEVPYRLSQYHWVDLFQKGGLNRLIMSLNKRATQLSPEILWGRVTTNTQSDLEQLPTKQQPPEPNIQQETEKRKPKQRAHQKLRFKFTKTWLRISIMFLTLGSLAGLWIRFPEILYAVRTAKAPSEYKWIDKVPDRPEYVEWIKDGHSSALSNPYFWTMYNGTNSLGERGNETEWSTSDEGRRIRLKPDPFLPYYGPGYRLDYPENFGNCAYCHAPAAVKKSNQDVNLSEFSNTGVHNNSWTEGVTCAVCHQVTGVLLGRDKLPYAELPGILSMDFMKPSPSQVVLVGPMDITTQVDGMLMKCSRIFSSSEFCAPCHYSKVSDSDVEIYGSYKEWLQSPYSRKFVSPLGWENKNYRSCQDCHMPSAKQIGESFPSEREACSSKNTSFHDFSHNMMQYGPDPENPAREIPLLVKGAAQISVEAKKADGQIKVEVVVVNTRAGHKFPTDSPLRHLILLVTASDWEGKKLSRLGGPTIPIWAGDGIGVNDYAGYAGKIYANVLRDKDTHLIPTAAYWNSVEPAWQGSDTRLLPGKEARSEYAFEIPSSGPATIIARLIYRRAFIDIAMQKGWSMIDLDVEVTQTRVEVP